MLRLPLRTNAFAAEFHCLIYPIPENNASQKIAFAFDLFSFAWQLTDFLWKTIFWILNLRYFSETYDFKNIYIYVPPLYHLPDQ